jgi:hypothetical protein
MSNQMKGALPPDREKTLSEISAADFLNALNAGGPAPLKNIHLWPEKKKLEYELEPTNLGTVKLGTILQVVSEKKKVELEKDVRVETPFKLAFENVVGRLSPDPDGDPVLFSRVATLVAAQLQAAR